MVQTLPTDEDFAAPDWLTPGAGTTECLPWFFWYLGFKPSDGIDQDTFTTYPWGYAANGSYEKRLETYGQQQLFIERGTPTMPVLMTQEGGSGQDYQRAVLCREEDSVAVEDIDYKVVFGILPYGGANLGASQGGSGGASPKAGGRFAFPGPISGSTDDNHINMGSGAGGNWPTGIGAISGGPSGLTLWAAWLGNSLFFRAGSGRAQITNAVPTAYARTWFVSRVDHYAFCAYPVINAGANRVDLYLELWQVKFTAGSGDDPADNIPRRLIQQIVDGGADQIDFGKPYFLRVTCDNNGSGNVDLNAYIGEYKQAGAANLAEAQCFKDGVFGNATYSVGTDVTHTSATGNVEDRHVDKITAFTDKTFGWGMGRDRTINVAPRLEPDETDPPPEYFSAIEGVYSVEVKDISAAVVLYRDEFLRCFKDPAPDGIPMVVVGLFPLEGGQANGLFAWDGYAANYSSSTHQIRRLMLWTDSQTDDESPNDYVSLDLGGTDSIGMAIYGTNVMREFVHARPSTQFYNHHRSIDFKPGAETDTWADYNRYRFGIALRGFHDGFTINGLVCQLEWETALDDTPSTAAITIAHLTMSYTDLAFNTSTGDQYFMTVIARRVWGDEDATHDIVDFISAFNIYGGAFHTLDFKTDIYPGATSPEAAALYFVELDGTPMELDEPGFPLVSTTVSPYSVTHPGPEFFSGNQEGFYFSSQAPRYDSGTNQNYAPFQVKNWTEGSLATDPIAGDPDTQASIVVGGEGTAVGSLNTTSGALAISGGGVWDVEVAVTVDSSYAIYRLPFASGHTYTSPATSAPRRRWKVIVRAASLAVFQSLQDFYDSHNGIETPFDFVVPVPSTTTTTRETVVGWFSDDALQVVEVGPQIYDISFTVEEELVA